MISWSLRSPGLRDLLHILHEPPLIALLTLSAIGISAAPLFIASMLIPPVHLYRQWKGGYSLSRWSALWRTAVLLMFAFISLNIFSLLLLAVGVLG